MRSSSFLTRFWQYLLSLWTIAIVTAIFFALRAVLDTTLIALLYLIPFVTILLTGPGKYSLDNLILKWKKNE